MERRVSLRAAGRVAGTLLAAALLVSGCGPSIIDEVAKDILFAQKYNLTVTGDDHCTTVPSGTVVVSHAELKSISATADAGYHVTGWTHESGAAVTFANAAAASTTVQLQAGNATIKAWTAPHDWELTVSNSTGGITDPSGTIFVLTDADTAISAIPDVGYHFLNWTLENGSGAIANPAAASTTVTLTTSNAEVQANFAINTYTLTVNTTGTGTIVEPASGFVTVNHGASTPITGTPGSINMLENWAVTAGTGATIANPTAESTTVTLTGGIATVTANFVEYHGTQTLAEHITYSDTGTYGSKCYMAYYDATNKDLKFRMSTNYGKTWGAAVTIDDSSNDVGEYCSMTVYKVPMLDIVLIGIAYYDATNQHLKYVAFADYLTSFSPVVVDSAVAVGKYCQMTNTGSKRCIAYYDETNQNLKIAKTSDGGAGTWFCETVDISSNDVGAYCSITCNSNGDFFMAYADATLSDVKRAWATNVSMDSETSWTIASYAYNSTVDYTGIALNGSNGVICFRGANSLKGILSSDSFATVGSHSTIDSVGGAGGYSHLRYLAGNFWISHNVNVSIDSFGTHQTKLAKSTDNGASWTLTTVASVQGGSPSMKGASFATDGTRLYVTYGYYDGVSYFLRLSKSTDGGVTW
jgi:hypothetical protein